MVLVKLFERFLRLNVHTIHFTIFIFVIDTKQ